MMWRDLWATLRRNRSAMAGLGMLCGLAFFALFGGILAPYDPLEPDTNRIFSPPSLAHPMGTDQIGRDVLSRIMAGTGFSLQTALLASLAAAVIGVPIGLLGGYYGGWIGRIVDLFTDAMLALPGIILALAVVTALGPGYTNAMLAIGASFSPVYARLVRGQVLSIRERTFIEAVRLMGLSDRRIVLGHVLPNAAGPIVVLMSLSASGAILAGAALSFLGLGAQPPTPEWGAIMFAGVTFLSNAPWITLFPGLAITLTVLATNLFGDGLRDALDPRIRQSAIFRGKTI